MALNIETLLDTAYCTIITKSHLAYARALATTLAEKNSQSKFFVLLADRIDGCFDPEKEPFELIPIEDLADQDYIQQMCFYYTPSELCFSLRAWLHEYMLKKFTFPKWIYLDSDIIVYHSLERISDQLDHCSILLSPHLLSIKPPRSINEKAVRRLESYLLRNGGIYNGGFLALRRSAESRAFIKWFKDHLRMYGFDNRPMQSGDQFWLTCVPLYFREVSIQRDPGANLAYWNLYERTIEQDASGKITVNGEPLLFFHFAGFDINKPKNLTKYALAQELKIVPKTITELANNYHHILLNNGHEETKNYPYAFGKFKDGQTITPIMRRIYFNLVYNKKVFKESPFEQHKYFQKRLRLQNIISSVKRALKYVIKQIRRYFKPDYYFDIP